MIQLIYICSAAYEPSEKDLIELLDQARSRNNSLNITGMLLYDNATYIQVLEGEYDDVHRVLFSIKKDERVGRLITLVDQEIKNRCFPNWSMGFKNLTNNRLENLVGFSEIFAGKVERSIADRKHELAVELLLSFAEDSESLRPVSMG